MPLRPSSLLVPAAALALAVLPAAPALAGDGGVGYPAHAASSGGGVEAGTFVPRARVTRPVATRFGVAPRSVREGGVLPRITLRVDQAGGTRVAARVVLVPLVAGRGKVVRISLGEVRTGRVVRRAWPTSARPVAGRYLVRLHVKDADGRTLARRARASGRAVLTVKAAPQPPAPETSQAPAPTVTTPAAAPTPAAPVAKTPAAAAPAPAPVAPVVDPAGGVFPLRGAWSYGDVFGASRKGYAHQGVDLLTAEGTPVVAPLAGTVSFVDNQPSAAGWYVVLKATTSGASFFFAHCQAGSVAVAPGAAVAAGGAICRAGHTGDATGPHLHLEVWPSGWRDVKGTRPADPKPLLDAWSAAAGA